MKSWKWRWVLFLMSINILWWKPSSINAETDPNDASALKVLYTSLNSPSQLTQWSSNGDDPCGQSWKGVICSGSRVTEITLSGLGLSGSLGYQLTSLTSLTNLDMSNNNLGGEISYQLPPNLQLLNLARNNFSKGIPYSVSQMVQLEYLNLSHNQLQGPLSDIFGKLSSLSTLDLSYNLLSGNLPGSFSSLSSIYTLYLQDNQFTGTINVLTNLPLQNLNVGNNHFTGSVPDHLQNINLQKKGNSWNSDPTPHTPPGTPTSTSRNNTGRTGGRGGRGGEKGGGVIAGVVVTIFIVGAIVTFFLIKRKSKKSGLDVEKLEDRPFVPLNLKEVHEMKSAEVSSKTFDTCGTINLKPPPMKSYDEEYFLKKSVLVKKASIAPINVHSYSLAELQISTRNFSPENLLDEGSLGRVYRAQFTDGKVFAVKKIDSSALPMELLEDFTKMVSKVSQLHHANITELIGYCSEYGQNLLVYEYHENSSLHDFLHLSDEFSNPLTWNSRIKIALGTGRALEYLHEVCSPSIVHNNIKSANILLDMELNPQLSDSGLASFMANVDLSTGFGYNAPEVTMCAQYTLKSDVYSFGIVMLELLTGRKPFDSSRVRPEQSLVRWATPQLHDIDALEKMVDPILKGLYPVKSLSRFADVIALCVQPEPEFRPPMSEVVQALVRLVATS